MLFVTFTKSAVVRAPIFNARKSLFRNLARHTVLQSIVVLYITADKVLSRTTFLAFFEEINTSTTAYDLGIHQRHAGWTQAFCEPQISVIRQCHFTLLPLQQERLPLNCSYRLYKDETHPIVTTESIETTRMSAVKKPIQRFRAIEFEGLILGEAASEKG